MDGGPKLQIPMIVRKLNNIEGKFPKNIVLHTKNMIFTWIAGESKVQYHRYNPVTRDWALQDEKAEDVD